MFRKRPLACSFCGKTDAEVEKLVAGPHVHICNRCVAIAARLMNGSSSKPQSPSVRPGFVEQFMDWFRRVRRDRVDPRPERHLLEG